MEPLKMKKLESQQGLRRETLKEGKRKKKKRIKI